MNFIVSVAVALSSILLFSWIYLPQGITESSILESRLAAEPTKYATESMQLAGVDVRTWENCSSVKFCSHRGRGSPFAEASEQAILFMLEQNVTCFDLDVIQSKDGVLFIGHPKSLASEKPVNDVFQLTQQELQSLFGDRLLSVDRFLSLLSTIPSDRRSALSITLEPKSSPDDLQILEALGALIREHGLQASVSVIVLDAAGGPSRGQGLQIALDKVMAAGVVPAVAVHDPQVAPVPSPLRTPPSAVRTVLFAAAALFNPLLFNLTGQVREGRRVVVYGMEDAQRLPEGVARGATAFISDDPLRLRGAWERVCGAERDAASARI